jgi:hypothetical protein
MRYLGVTLHHMANANIPNSNTRGGFSMERTSVLLVEHARYFSPESYSTLKSESTVVRSQVQTGCRTSTLPVPHVVLSRYFANEIAFIASLDKIKGGLRGRIVVELPAWLH